VSKQSNDAESHDHCPPRLSDRSRLIRSDGLTFDWDARFNIVARPRNGTPAGQQYAMLRTLLADRFKLRVHHETRPMPGYALTEGRKGRLAPQLRLSRIDCTAPYNNPVRLLRLIEGRDVCDVPDIGAISNVMVLRSPGAIRELARRLQELVDMPVLDETQLPGNYQWTLSIPRTAVEEADIARVNTALREQLGLMLEWKSVPVDFLVIDSVEMPSEN